MLKMLATYMKNSYKVEKYYFNHLTFQKVKKVSMLALLMEPYAMIQVSVLIPVINQMGGNVASMFHLCVSAELSSLVRD